MQPWEERFVREETELRERIDKLSTMLEKFDRGELDFEPKCPISLLRDQLWYMKRYDEILCLRASFEGVPLPE